MNELIRDIAVFDKKTEELVKEYILPTDITLEQLQSLFLTDDNDDIELVWVYVIKPEHTAFFKKYLDIDFNLKLYDYHLGASDPNI
tara:strand:- start:339 stop:596 length:258 start_codon:yes stop_codon:yes gene_type:complete